MLGHSDFSGFSYACHLKALLLLVQSVSPESLFDKTAVTKDGEMADILYFLDEEKIAQEAQYDGLYAVCTDLFDDEPEDILKVSESRWQIEACFRIMKTDFSARPVFVQRNDRIRAHFLVFFLNQIWMIDFYDFSRDCLPYLLFT